jgi:NADPH-dependent curcumin reductase CurA
MRNANRVFTLAARPTGFAGPEHFAEATRAVRAPEAGEVMVETLYLSVDPAMRVWISENPGYVPRIEIGDIMRAGGIGRVVESRDPNLQVGDLVAARLGWQTCPTLKAADVNKLDLTQGSAEDWIGLLGSPGLTAYFGLRDIGKPKPGETILVSGAAGAVGQLVAQIGKIEGCRVVGIAGGAEKCRRLVEELKLDAAIDYKAEPDLAAGIARACPTGVDVFYDNVGGETLEAAISQLAIGGRVIICGRISQTSLEVPYGVKNLGMLIGRRGRIQGFVVTDFEARFAEGRHWLAFQARAGRLKLALHVLDGLDAAPNGLGMLFRGENTGKLVVKVSD